MDSTAPATEPISMRDAMPTAELRHWSLPKRLAFRVAFVWFMLWMLPFPISALPWARIGQLTEWLGSQENATAKSAASFLKTCSEGYATQVAERWNGWKNASVLWLADHCFDKKFKERPSGYGSGDTTCDWIELFGITLAAIAAALVWSALAWRQKDHRLLFDWWRVLLRFELAGWLIVYGADKVIPAQMPAPDLDRLCEPVGEMTPMGMLWTFLGSSTAYEVFSGAAELFAGWLLVWRGTAALGGLVAVAVMGNVFTMNMCYDVPVKIFSARLMLQGAALAIPALPRLFRSMVLQRAVPAVPLGRLFPWKWANGAALVAGFLYLGDHTYQQIRGVSEFLAQRGMNGRESPTPLRGVWVVKSFELDGAPAVGDEDEVWRRVVVGNAYRLALETNGVPFARYFTELDPISKRTLTLTKRADPNWKSKLQVEFEGDERMSMTGSFDGHDLYVDLRKVPTPSYQLMTRGFHWINEFPNNQ